MRQGTRAKLSDTETIVFGPWRHFIPKFERAGVAKKIKRLFNRRTRHRINAELEKNVIE